MVSGYAREVKNGFVTIPLNLKDSRLSYEMVERNTDCSTLLFSLKIVRSRVSCKHGEARDTRFVSRVFAAPHSRGWAKTRHVTTNAIQQV